MEEHCGGGESEGGEAVWLMEGEECEGEKGCIYVMGDFDNSLYKTLQGNYRYVMVGFEQEFMYSGTILLRTP